MSNRIIGSGGKTGGASEDPNTLQNKAKLRVLGLISEGPIEGFPDTNLAKYIYANNIPLQGSDGRYNYDGISYAYRSGLPTQDYISGFTDSSSQVSLGDTEVLYSTPHQFTISQQADSAIVTIAIPALYDARADKGPKKTTVSFTIHVKTATGSFVLAHNKQLTNQKTVSRYEEDFSVPLPAGGAPWTIKITKLTQDPTLTEQSKFQNSILAARYQPVVEGKFSYRNRSVLGISIDAEQFGANAPNFKVKAKGIKVWVPKNYDPVTRVYSTTGTGTSNGTWDGTFKSAWTNNPAWILFDILTNNRYGLGNEFWPLTDSSQLINGPVTSNIDKWSLYVISQYCDGLVSNGYGSTEPRYTLNAQLKDRSDAYRLIVDILATFRGMLSYTNGQLSFIADKDESASFVFNNTNVIDGLFNYASSSQKTKYSVCIVKWNDPNIFGEVQTEVYEDPKLLATIGYRPVEFVALGCTSRALAQRLARWKLLTERLQGEVVSFSVGQEGKSLFPGSIVDIYDAYKSGARAGGRIVSYTNNSPNTTVVVDSFLDLNLAENPHLIYTNSLGVVQQLPIIAKNSSLKTYTAVGTIDTSIPEFSVYAVYWNSLKPQKYRTLTVSENTSDEIYTITALKHDPAKYSLIEGGLVLDPPVVSAITQLKPTAPSTISVYQWYAPVLGSESDARITTSWSRVEDANVIKYELQLETTTEPFKLVYEGMATTWSTEKLLTTSSTEYVFRVRTVDRFGRYSEWVQSTPVSAVGNTTVPAAPINLLYRTAGKVTELSWVNPTISDYKHTEIYINSANNFNTAQLLTTISGDAYTYAHTDYNTKYFWLRTVTNSLVNYTSAQSAVITVTPTQFTSNEISSVSWSAVSGSGKPQDNATVGATIGTNVRDSSLTILLDEELKNQYVALGSNLVVNSDFSRGVYGWYDTPAATILSVGVRNVRKSTHTTTVSGGWYALVQEGVYYSGGLSNTKLFALSVEEGERIGASVLCATENAQHAQVGIIFTNSSNTAIYTTFGNVITNSSSDGTNLGLSSVWEDAPADAAFAMVVVRVQSSGTVPTAYCAEPFICKMGSAQTVIPPYSVGRSDPVATKGAQAGINIYRTDGVTTLSQAEIRTIEGVSSAIIGQGTGATANDLTQLNSAEGSKLTGIETGATVGARLGTNVKNQAGTITLNDNDLITQQGISAGFTGQNWGATAPQNAIDNQYLQQGANQLADTRFRRYADTDYWQVVDTTSAAQKSTIINAGGFEYFRIQKNGGAALNSVIGIYGKGLNRFPVKAEQRLSLSLEVAGGWLSKIDIMCFYYNAAGGLVYTTVLQSLTSFPGGIVLTQGAGLAGNFIIVPANPTYASISIGVYGYTQDNVGNPYLFATQPMLAVASATQSALTPFNRGLESEIGADITNSNIAAGFTGQGALAIKNNVNLATTDVTNKSLANLDSTASTKLTGIETGATVGARLGTNVKNQAGTITLNDNDLITQQGISAGFTGQAALATKNAVDLSTSDVINKSLANLDATANTKLGGIEAGADVTANAQISLSGLLTTTFDFAAGSPISGQLPRNIQARAFKGGTEVTTGGTWSIANMVNCTVSVGASTGLESITALGSTGQVERSYERVFTYNSVAYKTKVTIAYNNTDTAAVSSKDGVPRTFGNTINSGTYAEIATNGQMSITNCPANGVMRYYGTLNFTNWSGDCTVQLGLFIDGTMVYETASEVVCTGGVPEDTGINLSIFEYINTSLISAGTHTFGIRAKRTAGSGSVDTSGNLFVNITGT